MWIWTISAAAGAGGERIGADLAEAAGVPLLDFKALSSFAGDQLGDIPTWHTWKSGSAAV